MLRKECQWHSTDKAPSLMRFSPTANSRLSLCKVIMLPSPCIIIITMNGYYYCVMSAICMSVYVAMYVKKISLWEWRLVKMSETKHWKTLKGRLHYYVVDIMAIFQKTDCPLYWHRSSSISSWVLVMGRSIQNGTIHVRFMAIWEGSSIRCVSCFDLQSRLLWCIRQILIIQMHDIMMI